MFDENNVSKIINEVGENYKERVQYILDENGELAEISLDKCKKVEHPIKYRIKNAFEVFVRVEGTENYWISNYGRCVNNYRRKGFYAHKEGKCHYTIFDIEKDGSTYRNETSPEELVAETFLVKYAGRLKVWHKDGDETNNWYKNLLTVSAQDYKDLKAGKITWQELNLEQEYIEYENKAGAEARKKYETVKARCGYTEDKDYVRDCYNKSTMWDVWLNEPKKFMKWYLEHYYECGDEEMDVDKDLFGDGSGMYHEDFCCLLPKTLNTMLANAKKHYEDGETPDNVLPLGVRYNSKLNKYYGEITFTGAEEPIQLSYCDTKEEAFAEYKMMKQADILMMAAKYKGKIPDYIYDKLLTVEVKPY